jgi:outer membrane murein-binding lipoprotein Lpp
MHKFGKLVAIVGVALLFSSSTILTGCSSGPDEAQLKQLDELKGEVASLAREVDEKEKQAEALTRELAAKNDKLQKCNDDQQVVKQRLAK